MNVAKDILAELNNQRIVILLLSLAGAIAAVVLVVFIFVVCDKISKYRQEYKAAFIKPAVERMFGNMEFSSDGKGLDISLLEKIGLVIGKDNRFESNDLVSGKYKNIQFLQSDIKFWDSTSLKHGRVIFKGRWIIIETDLNFKCQVRIAGKKIRSKSIQNWKHDKEFCLASVGDDDFGKLFKVYVPTENAETYNLPSYIQKSFMQISDLHKNKVLFVLHENKIHIGIGNKKDAFEPPYLRAINEQYIETSTQRDIKLITDIADNI